LQDNSQHIGFVLSIGSAVCTLNTCASLTLCICVPVAQELRRGTESAHIHSIAFSQHCDWLAVSSDKGTVHIFALCPSVVTGSDDSDPNKATDGPTAAAQQQQQQQQQLQLQQQQQQGAAGGGRHNPTSMISNLVKVGDACSISLAHTRPQPVVAEWPENIHSSTGSK
jgi:hypothetical protein